MIDVVTQNPGMTATCLFCFWPLIIGVGGVWFGRMVERHGWPVVSWARPHENEGGEL